MLCRYIIQPELCHFERSEKSVFKISRRFASRSDMAVFFDIKTIALNRFSPTFFPLNFHEIFS
jgi:hypothetical protein